MPNIKELKIQGKDNNCNILIYTRIDPSEYAMQQEPSATTTYHHKASRSQLLSYSVHSLFLKSLCIVNDIRTRLKNNYETFGPLTPLTFVFKLNIW